MYRVQGFPQIVVYFCGGPHDKDYGIWEFYIGVPCFGVNYMGPLK